jgi:signal transduction histidine kinase/ActR/RegA family two-component response regulator
MPGNENDMSKEEDEVNENVKSETGKVTFRQCFEKIPGLYLILKAEDYEIVAASDAYLNATMTERSAIIGKEFFEVFPSDPGTLQANGVERMRDSLEIVKTEHHANTVSATRYPIPRRKSKRSGFEQRWWNSVNAPVINSKGDIEYIIHRLEDVTPIVRRFKEENETELFKKLDGKESLLLNDIILHGQDWHSAKGQADKTVLDSEKKYHSLFESIDKGFCIIKVLFDDDDQPVDYRFLEVNPAFKEQTGLENAEGKRVRQLVPHHEEYWFDIYGKVALTGEPARFEQAAEALNRYYDVYAFPFGEPDDRQVAVLFDDIARRKQAEKDLREMNETLEEQVEKRTEKLQSYQHQLRSLASKLNRAEEQERRRLATELHNNLGQMLAVAKMKINELATSKLPGSASNAIADLSEVVNEALSYTRELMTELKPPPVLDKEEVTEVLEWVVKEIEKYGLKVTIQDDGRPKPLSEKVRTTIYQCVKELLFNIVKYAGVNKACLAMSRVDGNIKIIVEDEGKGFDMTNNKPIPTEDGGFGLFNIRERIDWIGGRFDITSQPGLGTKAILHIPVKNKENDSNVFANEVEENSFPRSEQDHQVKSWSKLKILIADDHQMVRNGFRQMINKQDDLTVIGEASDGEEVVRMARETAPDVILMDVNMPGMDGLEATKKISSAFPEVCIIGLSLHDREEVKQNMLSAGAKAYLSKDQAFEMLCETIRSEAKRRE